MRWRATYAVVSAVEAEVVKNKQRIRLKDFHASISGMMEWTPSMPDLEVFIDVDGRLYEIAMVGGGGSQPIVTLSARTESLSARLAILEGRASADASEADNQNHRDAVAAIALLGLSKTGEKASKLQQYHPPEGKPQLSLLSDNGRKSETPEIEPR